MNELSISENNNLHTVITIPTTVHCTYNHATIIITDVGYSII